MSFGPLVSAAWLHEHLGEPDLRVIDLRWYLAHPAAGRANHLQGHIPGAAFCDVDSDINGPDGPGRHPLPGRAQFEAAMRACGVDRGDRVVAYDDTGGSIAARLWFLLPWFGHPDAAVLDGGIQAWGGPLESGAVTPEPGDFVAAEPPRDRILSFADVAMRGEVVLLDARVSERYRGEVEPTGVRAGHIPGARSAPWPGNLKPDGTFKAPEDLRAQYQALGVEGPNAVAYCGSGVTACHDLLALEIAGLRGARLYEGSWSEWAVRAGAPVATGAEP